MAYPYVTCDDHPGKNLGIVVCVHVLSRAPIAYFERPSQSQLGVAVCSGCDFKGNDVNLDDLKLCCYPHFKEAHYERVQ